MKQRFATQYLMLLIMDLIAAVLHMERWDNGTWYDFYFSEQLLKSLKELEKCND